MDEPVVTGEKHVIRDEHGRFVEGVSGNPEGRPKGRFSITSQIIKRLETNPQQTEEIINWLIANRKDLVWNKIDPNPPQDLNLGGQPGLPFTIVIKQKEENESGTVQETI